MSDLDELIEELSDDDAERWLEFSSVDFPSGDQVILDLVITEYDRPESAWRITCDGVREYVLSEAVIGHVDLLVGDEPVVRRHTDEVGRLYFTGAAADPHRVIGRLWAVHEELFEGWVPYTGRAADLLKGPGGLLAEGPRFLLERYAGVLEEEGLKTSMVGFRAPEGRGPLQRLKLGEQSFIIASRFEASRLEIE